MQRIDFWKLIEHGDIRAASEAHRIVVTQGRNNPGMLHVFDVVDDQFFHARSANLKPGADVARSCRALIRAMILLREHKSAAPMNITHH